MPGVWQEERNIIHTDMLGSWEVQIYASVAERNTSCVPERRDIVKSVRKLPSWRLTEIRGLNGTGRMPTHTIRFAMIGARSRRGNAPYAVGNSTRAERP